MNKRLLLWIGVLLVTLSTPVAADVGGFDSLADVLGNLGDAMETLIDSPGFQFGLTFILFFMLSYAIYAAGLKKVSAFKGEGEQPNKQGRTIAVSLGLMTAMGVAYWANFAGSVFVERVLSVAGVLGGIGFAALVFGLLYYNMKQGDKAHVSIPLFGAALALFTYATLLGEEAPWTPIVKDISYVLFLLAAIWAIKDLPWGHKAGGEEDEDTLGSKAAELAKDWWNRKPSKVKDIAVQLNSDETVGISWSENHKKEEVTGYEIRRDKRRPGGSWERDAVFPAQHNNRHTDSLTIEADKEYRYMVRAENERGKGKWSSPVMLNIPTATVLVYAKYTDGHASDGVQDLTVWLTAGSAQITLQQEPRRGVYKAELYNITKLYTLNIKDNHGAYKPRTVANAIDVQTRDHYNNPYREGMEPEDNVYGRVTLYTDLHQGEVVRATPRGDITHATPKDIRVGPGGTVTYEGMPAGIIAGLFLHPKAGMRQYDSYNNGVRALVRYPNQTNHINERALAIPRPGPRTVDIYCYNHEGSPVDEVDVQLVPNDGRGTSSNWGQTDIHGHCQLQVPPGFYDVRALENRFTTDPNHYRGYPVFNRTQRINVHMVPKTPLP